MPNFISEDQIEQAMVQRLQHLCGYDAMNCYTTDPDDTNDDSGCTDKREVILRDRLKEAAIALNPGFPESAIDDAIKQLCDKRQALSLIAANREVDSLIRDGVRVEFRDEQGRNRKERVKVIDFSDPASPLAGSYGDCRIRFLMNAKPDPVLRYFSSVRAWVSVSTAT